VFAGFVALHIAVLDQATFLQCARVLATIFSPR
jgi:hypothetical protein